MWYLVTQRTMTECSPGELVFPDETWRRRCPQNGLCPTCGHVDRRRYPAPFDIVLQQAPEGQPCPRVEGTGVTIWRREVVEMVAEHLRDLAFGRCFLADGSELSRYVTCYSRDCVVIRGNRYSRYQTCPDCGTIVSHVKPGPQYLLRGDVGEGKVCQDAFCRLILPEAVVLSQPDLDGWDGDPYCPELVALEPLYVRDEPAVMA